MLVGSFDSAFVTISAVFEINSPCCSAVGAELSNMLVTNPKAIFYSVSIYEYSFISPTVNKCAHFIKFGFAVEITDAFI